MDKIFQTVFEISSELGSMHEFYKCTENIHEMTKCDDENCDIKGFLEIFKSNVFDEEILYAERRKCFTEHRLKNIKVFNAMCKLQQKGKENIEKIEHLISQTEEIRKENKSKEEKLAELISQKQLHQQKIESLMKEIYLKQ